MTETKSVLDGHYPKGMRLVEPFVGPIETNNTCIGGPARSTHAGVRRERFSASGAVDGTAMVRMKDRVSGLVATTLVINANEATLQSHATDHAEANAMIYTSDHKARLGLALHATVCHSVAEVDKSMVGNWLQHPKLVAP